MRMLLCVLLCLVASCCASIPNQYERTKPATVLLQWPAGVQCSGTATGPHSILSATHCTAAVGDAGKVKINGVDGSYVVIADDGNDHVLLRVTQRQAHVARIVHQTFRPGAVLYVWGNPHGIEGVLRIGRIAGSDKDSTFCLSTLKRDKCAVIYYDANLSNGDSGAGIFNRMGELVGIESGGATLPQAAFKLPFFYPLAFTAKQLAEATH